MNIITVFLIEPSTLRLSFAYDSAINERIKTLPGWDWNKKQRIWTVPLSSLDRLLAEFGDQLAIDPDVVMAANPKTPVMCFVELLHQAGIELTEADGRLIGFGGAYCPDPWQKLIDERADALRRIMFTKQASSTSVPAPVTTVTLDDLRLTDFDRTAAQFEPAWIAAAQRKQDMIERRRASWQR